MLWMRTTTIDGEPSPEAEAQRALCECCSGPRTPRQFDCCYSTVTVDPRGTCAADEPDATAYLRSRFQLPPAEGPRSFMSGVESLKILELALKIAHLVDDLA